MAFIVTPRTFTLSTKRSAGDYMDQIVIETRIVHAESARDPEGPPLADPQQPRAAYLAFRGSSPAPITLTDDDWGLFQGWGMPVDDPLSGDLFLDIVVSNVRGASDKSWAAYVLAVAAIGAGIYIGAGTDLPEKLVAALDEYGISPADLAEAVDKGWSAVGELFQSIFGGMPDCRGPVFVGRALLSQQILEDASARGVPITVDEFKPLAVDGPCQQPHGRFTFDVVRRIPENLPYTAPPTFQAEPVQGISPDQLAGDWVDEADALGVIHAVLLSIRRQFSRIPGVTSNALSVSVRELDPARPDMVLVERAYADLHIERMLLPKPAATKMPQRQDASPVPLPPRTGFDPLHPSPLPSDPMFYTCGLSLQKGDYGKSSLEIWQRRTIAADGSVLDVSLALFYRRGGDDGVSNTACWLVRRPSRPVA